MATIAKTLRHDSIRAQRLTEYRTAYIDKSQAKAAELIGIPQPSLSNMENGKIPVRSETIQTLVDKFGMNSQWFLEGKGKPNDKEFKKKNLVTDIVELNKTIDKLTFELLILNKNQDHLFKLMDALQSEMETLKSKIRE